MIPVRSYSTQSVALSLRRCVGVVLAATIAAALPAQVLAEASVDKTDTSSVAPAPQPGNRRIELRRALESGTQYGATHDRRRLSLEEREALHRDLRAVMRNVNADHGNSEKR